MKLDDPGRDDRARPPARGVTLRLYRQGLGDCFLLAFPRGEAEPFYLLIDCGVILGTPEPKRVMEAVVRDIAAATGGRIDLLVITHEHWDHVSGFVQAEDVWKSSGIRIDTVWMAWTENPGIPLAMKLKQDFRNDLDALRLALDRAGPDATHSSALLGLVGLFGDPLELAAAAKAKRRFSEVTHEALNKVRDLAGDRVQYRKPGEALTLPGVPGVRVYILGPPENERALRNINPSRREPQTYTKDSDGRSRRKGRSEPNEKSAFTLALRHGAAAGTAAQALTGSEEDVLQRCYPFEGRFRLPLNEASETDFFRRRYGFAQQPASALAPAAPVAARSEPPPLPPGPAWRRIDGVEALGLTLRRERAGESSEGRGKRRTKAAKAAKQSRRSKTVRKALETSNFEPASEPAPASAPAPPSERAAPTGPPAENAYPFDKHLRVDLAGAARMPFFWEFYGFDGDPPSDDPLPAAAVADASTQETGPEWRRIDNDWLGLADELALQMDSYTNNTSLAMAIELVGSGKVLLFPADAQVGNWLSWDAIKPELVADDGKKVAAADLLRRTVFYKVGHHGSHNATMRETGLERMVSQELVAFVPVDERVAHEVRNWRDMPFEPLLAQLYEKTRGRVIRLDQGVVTDARPHFLAEDVWQQLAATARTFRDERLQTGGQFPSANGGQDPLYYQLAITDDEGRS